MLLRLPSSRLWGGRREKKKKANQVEPEARDVPAPTKAPAAAPAAPAAPAVLLPGVLEEATRQRSRWQPLFRDPSFGGSIAKSQAREKRIKQQRSFVFEDEAEHLLAIEKTRSSPDGPDGPVAASGRLREVWKIVVQHKDHGSEGDPGSPSSPVSETGSPRNIWDYARNFSKRSNQSAFSNVSSTSGHPARPSLPSWSSEDSKRASWPSEESRKKSPWPSEDSGGRKSGNRASRASSSSGLSCPSSVEEVSQAPTDHENQAFDSEEPVWERKSSGSQLLPTSLGRSSLTKPQVRTPRSPKSPKSPKSAGGLALLTPEAPRLASLALSLGMSHLKPLQLESEKNVDGLAALARVDERAASSEVKVGGKNDDLLE